MILKEKSFEYYIHKLTHLRRDNKYGGAPHKPILLLSIIGSIKFGTIKNNKIFITPELVGFFKKKWSELVTSERHHAVFALPFYHMRTEPFWKLIPKAGYEKAVQSKIAMRSFTNLDAAVEYGEIDEQLFNFISRENEREVIEAAILEKYFPEKKSDFSNYNDNYIEEIEEYILKDPPELYKNKLKKFQKESNKESFEEEIFLRKNVFRRQIPILYKNTCAISGLQIDATLNVSLIDACHIIPFRKSFDDTVTNGISLTPTLHRAFDRGLISIKENYEVIISDKFNENEYSNYSIKQFEGKKILLPENRRYYPDIDNLIWHNKNIFIG